MTSRYSSQGWSVTVSPISGQLTISRVGCPGQIELPVVDDTICIRLVDDNDQIVDSITAQYKHLSTRRILNV